MFAGAREKTTDEDSPRSSAQLEAAALAAAVPAATAAIDA